jgi:3-oxoacyl-[acyl-carrier protein] reductase/2-[hydroxy(phenyl)methyl]-succinyl-CoA dehydrogenase BbsC subunit
MQIVKDRSVFIAGVADDVCEAIGLRLAKAGAKIFIAGDDQAKIDGIVSRIKNVSENVAGLSTDLRKADEVKKAVGAAMDKFGEINILINNVDDPLNKIIAEMTDEDWTGSLQNNLYPVFFLCREIVPRMAANKYGRVINIGSIDYLGWQGKSGYSAAKSALFGLTRSLALETGRDNITVNSVIKGDITVPGLNEEAAAKLANSLPVKRLGRPEDISYAVEYFASDTSKYVTGQTLFVCGGRSIHSSMSI